MLFLKGKISEWHLQCYVFYFSEDKTQVTMLVMWLIEIYLNQLGVLKEQGEDMDQKYDRLQEEFRKYLNQPRVKVQWIKTYNDLSFNFIMSKFWSRNQMKKYSCTSC